MISSLFSSFLLFFLPLLPVRFSCLLEPFLIFSPVARQYNSAGLLVLFLPLFVTDTLPMYPCPFMFFLPLFVTDIPPTNRQNWLCFKTVFKIWPCSFPPQKRGLRTACMGNWSFQKQSIGSAPTCKIAHERVNWSITFDFGLHDGVDVRTVGRTGRSVGRTMTS